MRQGLKETLFFTGLCGLLVGAPIVLARVLLAPATLPQPNYNVSKTPLVAPQSMTESKNLARLDQLLGDKYTIQRPIPRVFLTQLPGSLKTEDNVQTRKHKFTITLLPLILRANEMILENRHHASKLRRKIQSGRQLSQIELNWLKDILGRFRLKLEGRGSIETIDRLLYHMDIIPPSLAIAQAAIETGWGKSFFSQEGNALYGEWVWGDDKGILPRARDDGKTHRIKSFDDLLGSVVSYMTNLNRHNAYHQLRERRAELRHHNLPITGPTLAPALGSYSERGMAYVSDILSIINYNGFTALDNAQLSQS